MMRFGLKYSITSLGILGLAMSNGVLAQAVPPTNTELQQQLTTLASKVQSLENEKNQLTQKLQQIQQQHSQLDTSVKSLKTQLESKSDVPVGSIVAWHKNLPGTPDLGADWQICDGQLITDPESPLYGQSTPDLNSQVYAGGRGRYLRGGNVSGQFNESTRLADNGYKYGFTNLGRYYGVAVLDVYNAEDWNGNFYSQSSRVSAHFQTTAMTVVWAIKIK